MRFFTDMEEMFFLFFSEILEVIFFYSTSIDKEKDWLEEKNKILPLKKAFDESIVNVDLNVFLSI